MQIAIQSLLKEKGVASISAINCTPVPPTVHQIYSQGRRKDCNPGGASIIWRA